jgi:uncharacterized oxidoreductase
MILTACCAFRSIKAIQTGHVKPAARLQVLNESATTASLDAQSGFGQVAARYAMSLAMDKARQSGIAAVTVRNSYHTGRIASYTLMAAEQGFVSVVMVNAGGGGQSVAPFGGTGRRLATNPISIAAPAANGQPVVIDFATSVAPEGKVRDYFQQGRSVPAGWIVDSFGQPTTNPKDFYTSPEGCSFRSADKSDTGFGLGFMIDLMAGALSGAGVCRPNPPEPRDGLLMIALDVRRFVSLNVFQQQVAQLVAHVKSCPAAPGYREVCVPGEVEKARRNGGALRELKSMTGLGLRLCEVAAGSASIWPTKQFAERPGTSEQSVKTYLQDRVSSTFSVAVRSGEKNARPHPGPLPQERENRFPSFCTAAMPEASASRAATANEMTDRASNAPYSSLSLGSLGEREE